MTLMLRNSSGGVFAPKSANEILPEGIYNSQTILLTPAISPNDLQNPAFRQVFYRPQDGRLLDYDQHYTSLKATQSDPYGIPLWKREYRFKEAYNVSDLSPSTMFELYKRLRVDQTLFSQWKSFHITQSKAATDFDEVSDERELCTLSGFCNYLEPCLGWNSDE
jgi:hypothetical protein